MKEVMAIIRPNCVTQTREKLAEIGIHGFTGRSVNGKGKEPVNVLHADDIIGKSRMLTKRAILTVVEDDEVDKVIKAILEVNYNGNQGDGKIFVNPILRAYTISTGRCVE